MKTLYFEAFSGISGDMTVGALVSLGVPFDYLQSELKKLSIANEFVLTYNEVKKSGIKAGKFNVIPKEKAHQHGRHLNDIVNIISNSQLNTFVKDLSIKIFTTLGECEAAVHGTSIDKIHFHEVGAIDSIVDIVGASICIDYLKPDRILASSISEGSGTVECEHGIMPVPVPAVAEILRKYNIPFNITENTGELVTPTGIAILANLAQEYKPFSGTIKNIGIGAGTKDFKQANILRIYESIDNRENTIIIETNIDDSTPEILSFAMEKLLSLGALDVFFTPVYMKKNRPAQMLSVICNENLKSPIIETIFTETSAIGCRIRPLEREMMERQSKTIKTKYGEIKVKVCKYNNIEKIYPEYESAKTAAIKNNLPLNIIYSEVGK